MIETTFTAQEKIINILHIAKPRSTWNTNESTKSHTETAHRSDQEEVQCQEEGTLKHT